MQVFGHKDGLAMMERADPLILLVGLPTIPITLVLGKMLRWEKLALHLLRRHAYEIPILRQFFASRYVQNMIWKFCYFGYGDYDHIYYDRVQSENVPPMSDSVSIARIICGALLLPSIASICGKIFFGSIHSNFQRTLLVCIRFTCHWLNGYFKFYLKCAFKIIFLQGGIAFITIKGAFKIYHKQQQYIRQCQRRIMDYTENNVAQYGRQ